MTYNDVAPSIFGKLLVLTSCGVMLVPIASSAIHYCPINYPLLQYYGPFHRLLQKNIISQEELCSFQSLLFIYGASALAAFCFLSKEMQRRIVADALKKGQEPRVVNAEILRKFLLLSFFFLSFVVLGELMPGVDRATKLSDLKNFMLLKIIFCGPIPPLCLTIACTINAFRL